MANDILITTETLKHILPVYENHILEQAKNENAKINLALEPANDDIPVVFLSSGIPTSKNPVQGELEYKSRTRSFHAFTLISLQGNSSLAHPKKNFTINLYKDEARSDKMNIEFKQWGAHNNFVLKANYIDHLHARNIVCANLWADIVRSRPDFDSLPEELKNSPNCGAIDGFPIKVYINGEYQGIYTWNIPKCDWQFGLDKNNPNHVLLCGEFNDNWDVNNEYNPCNFNTHWNGSDKYWSVEVGELSQQLINRFNKIVDSINNEDCKKLAKVCDIQSIIDYFIFQDVIYGADGLAKNMLLVSYDDTKFYLSAYDLDTTFDLSWNGKGMFNAAYRDVSDYLNRFSALRYCLWPFPEFMEIRRNRYIELRKTILSYSSIISRFENYLSLLTDDIRICDTYVHKDIPLIDINTLSYLSNWIIQRLSWTDDYYNVVWEEN